ncbi:MAG: methyltransferase domain-containing protein [Elusimicrobiota bacterium]|jgi:geranyl diphosphate 2-C-methyltransferase
MTSPAGAAAWRRGLLGAPLFTPDPSSLETGLLRPLRPAVRRASALPALRAAAREARDSLGAGLGAKVSEGAALWTAGALLAEELLLRPGARRLRPTPEVGERLTLSMTAQNLSRAFFFNGFPAASSVRVALHRCVVEETTAWALALACRASGRGADEERACAAEEAGARLCRRWSAALSVRSSRDPHAAWKRRVAELYDSKRDDFNRMLGFDGLIHHHNGLCPRLPARPGRLGEERLLALLHRQESALTEHGLRRLGRLRPAMRGLDAGCGRGGSSLLIAGRSGCRLDGVNLSAYQVAAARRLARTKGLSGRVRFLRADMLASPFPPARFDFVWACESTEHAPDLHAFLGETARVAKAGAPMVVIAWVRGSSGPASARSARLVDAAYRTCIHEERAYRATEGTGWRLELREDLTRPAARYWKLRGFSAHRTGTERFMEPAFASGAVRYLLFLYRRSR